MSQGLPLSIPLWICLSITPMDSFTLVLVIKKQVSSAHDYASIVIVETLQVLVLADLERGQLKLFLA
jgi:hypothetical protein